MIVVKNVIDAKSSSLKLMAASIDNRAQKVSRALQLSAHFCSYQ